MFICDYYLILMVDLKGNATSMLPSEMGHAAAYEAYRTWIHNSSMYEPLSGDIDRQREGLIGLAVAEGDYRSSFPQSQFSHSISTSQLHV